ncbi:MAG TPA: phospholipase D-like domain-containing protein [Burkholderiales bacterium]|jgi:cardiolipin synthase|nr:phospholipase D-like domain-containing protein [Burkholderiales bacterium]
MLAPAMRDAVDMAFAGAVIVAAVLASGHAVLYKRDTRAAALWLAVVWVLPALGPLLYITIGVNRVERRATRLRRRMVRHRTEPQFPPGEPGTHLLPLARLVGQVVGRPLLPGNSVEALIDGVHAFPAMLEAIGRARRSIAMASYIFDGNGIGAQFVTALAAARARGVEVRVLIDDVDARWSSSSAVKPLRREGVDVAVFNPPFVPARLHAVNLRNHRKILVVDGVEAYTGGLNVDSRYWRPEAPERANRDLHFRLRGPVVAHMMEVFADDWHFTTEEALRGEKWFPKLGPGGEILGRAIEAGPDESFERVRWAIIGGLSAAQRSVRILTPYFLPDQSLITALDAVALRGVEVDIVIPERSDLPHVHWAAFGQLWQVLERGCRVWLRPGAFDHSKLMVVDGAWTLLGSANWDARSLRLNFELNVECYSVELGAHLDGLVQARIAGSRPYTLRDDARRRLPAKLRDGVARLFAPYL